jgi:hypothetical protein
MWDFWGSDLRALRRVVAAAALLALAAAPASARTRAAAADSTVDRTDVTISRHGVSVRSGGSRVEVGGRRGLGVTVDERDSSGREHGRVVVVGPNITVDDDGQLVRVFSDVVVKEGETVDGDVVSIFGSSKIDGHVVGNTVAVFGSVTLGPRAAVDGDMVAILGTIHRAPTATVGGESVDIGIVPPLPGLPPLPAILLMFGLLWLLSIFGGWIVSLVMPERLLRITATASRRTVGSVLLGLTLLPITVTVGVLLSITVIGIPVAVLLPVAFLVVLFIGQFAGAYGLGLKLLRRRLGQGSMIAALAVGTLFVSLFFVAAALLAAPPGLPRTFALFLVAVGGLFGFALTTIGSGAVLLSRFGTTPRELALGTEPEAAPAPAPSPAAPPAIGA